MDDDFDYQGPIETCLDHGVVDGQHVICGLPKDHSEADHHDAYRGLSWSQDHQVGEPVVKERSHHHMIQRTHEMAGGETVWVDTSACYYGDEGKAGAIMKRDDLREIFGQENVRVVRRDVMVTEVETES